MAAELRFEDYLSRVPPQSRDKLNAKISSDIELAEIAQSYTDWQGSCSYLGLKETDVENIEANRNVGVQRYV